MQQSQTFVSAVNGAKFQVTDPVTAALLGKNEKKEIIHKSTEKAAKAGKAKKENAQLDDNEQEIS